MAELLLYKPNLGGGKFSLFPKLSTVEKYDEELLTYCQHLNILHSNFNQRFEDILKINILDLVLNLLKRRNTNEPPKLQEVLICLTTNEQLKFKFKDDYQQYWLQKQIPAVYPGLCGIIQKFPIIW